jgi:apolipoprotein N-acyltransferase
MSASVAVCESVARAAAPRTLPWPAAVAAAVLSGLALLVAFPPYDLWWLAPVGVALLAMATHRRMVRAAPGWGSSPAWR